eukprot:3537034-Rhodomonas_salina.1
MAEKQGSLSSIDDDLDTRQNRTATAKISAVLNGYVSSLSNMNLGAGVYSRFRVRRTKRHAKKILILNPSQRIKHKRRVAFRLPKSRERGEFQPLKPDSLILRRWAHFMVIPLSYEIGAWPFRLAFGDSSFNAAVKADVVFDIIFCADMVRQCLSVIPAGTLPNQDEAIRSFAAISRHYLSSRDFLKDLLPIVVYYTMLSVQWGSADLSLWLFWAGTLPRIAVRAARLRHYFKVMSRDLTVNARMLEGVKFAMIIFFSSHW